MKVLRKVKNLTRTTHKYNSSIGLLNMKKEIEKSLYKQYYT